MNKRDRRSHDDDDDGGGAGGGPVDPTNTTLFVHGLHKDVTGQLQSSATGDALIRQALSGARSVRRPTSGTATSSFCFVDFASHDAAKHCLELHQPCVTIQGVELTIRWASRSTSGGGGGERTHQHKKPKTDASAGPTSRLTEAQAKDSSAVYFKLPNLPQPEQFAASAEALRQWAETTLEDALAGDGAENERVTAKDEPALQVQVRVVIPNKDDADTTTATAAAAKPFGFLDFASHAAASMALATLTGSTDGGPVLEDAKGRPDNLQTVIYLHWAKAKPEAEAKDIIRDASGFTFERKHFPADSRQDCWFCLASEACEKHLITGVFDSCYAAMPKGPVHEGHILLIPVQHTSQGALKDPVVSKEIEELKERLRRHASSAYEMDLFVFERAIQTKGGYHTHVQCVPVPRKLGVKLHATMLAQARRIGMDIREMNSNLNVSTLLKDSDDDEGYFYAEIPAGGMQVKRFLYKSKVASNVRVPLQFGREILAAVMEKPELAHWKSCVLDKEKEAQLASAFRQSIAEN